MISFTPIILAPGAEQKRRMDDVLTNDIRGKS